jgi:hypothetical protein
MPQQTELAAFLDELHDEVHARSALDEAASADMHEIVFTELIAEELGEYGAIEELVPCLIEQKTPKGNIRAHGYYIDEEGERLDIFVSFYRQASEGDTITQTDIRHGFERARRILQLVDEGWDIGDPTQSDQATMIAAIREAANQIREIRVFILTDCAARDTSEISEVFGNRHARCLIWDATRLLRIRNSGKAYEAIEIDVTQHYPEGIPCLAMPDRACGYRTYLAMIPGDFLCRLYDEYGARLLQLNVRSFLQVRGKVNKGIRSTIINEPGRFLAYNNGITATVESLKCGVDSSGHPVITHLVGFQVVNGGQTIASIHHAGKKDNAPLQDILVQAKISEVDEDLMEELVPSISRYANTQNRVNEADFSSNDPLHVRIEELCNRIWTPGERSRWFYERARGQYQVAKARVATTPAKSKKFGQEVPTSQKFTKTDLAKYLNSWGQQPDVVSKGAQKNFTAFMDSLSTAGEAPEQDESWYKRIIVQAIIFKETERVARKLKLTPYRANAITYTVALISYRTQRRVDLDAIWEAQSVSEPLSRTIEAWMPKVHQELVKSAKGRNVTEWCKKADCWRHIQTMDVALPADLEAELAEGQPLPNVGRDAKVKNLQLTPEDRENIAKVMLVPDKVWLDIHRWGRTDGNLEEWQYGIAHTLVEYAAGGWAKVPSRKQATHAVAILEKARGHVPSLDMVERGAKQPV